jgi:hypothetical protein
MALGWNCHGDQDQVGSEFNLGASMSKKAAERHRTAAEHHTQAAKHHGSAAESNEGGKYEKAAHHAQMAHGHQRLAEEQGNEATKATPPNTAIIAKDRV